ATELERAVGDRRDEFAEVLAHHAERAFALSAEVRAQPDVLMDRARRALDRALALGDRALRREDLGLLASNAAVSAAALAALGERATPEDRARTALLEAERLRLSGDFGAALPAFGRAIELADAAGRADVAAWAHLGSARVFVLAGDFDETPITEFDGHLSEAARLFTAGGDGGAAVETGIVDLERYWASGELSVMLERGAALLGRARSLGDRPREMLLAARLVGAAGVSGQRELADEYLGIADGIAASDGLRVPFWVRAARCQLHAVRGDTEAAIACQVRLHAEAVAEHDPVLEIATLRNAAENLLELGRIADAQPLLEQGLALSVRMGELWNRTELTADLGVVAAELGDHDRAQRLIAEARELQRATDRFAVAFVCYSAGRVHQAVALVPEAYAQYRMALDLMSRTEYHVPKSWMQLRTIEFLLRNERLDEARREFELAEPFLDGTIGDVGRRVAAIRGALASSRTPG
ncbi:MAG TPA: hypothetical protein VGT60_05140, partial [Candidatus Limnocylindria bacterium]|nr:hypothetical protein [Candidatus Limnocylindria bacterium]